MKTTTRNLIKKPGSREDGEKLLKRIDELIARTKELGEDAARAGDVETGWFADAQLKIQNEIRAKHLAKLKSLEGKSP